MADHYTELTSDEKAYWDEYTRLRELSDWPAYSAEQGQRRSDSRDWLTSRRKQIYRLAQPKSEGGDGQGWHHSNRRERYEQLRSENLNSGTCRRLCQLPTGALTDDECVLVSEREMWWNVSSADESQKGAKQACTDWLIARRKQLWHLIEDEGSENNRQTRYQKLCIATRYGSAYDDWAKTHNTETGAEKGSGVSSREKAVQNCRKWLGTSERPANSNKGPHIDDWCRRVYGGTGVPWCACFATCMAWDSGVKGSSSAGVSVIMGMAKQGRGMFSGWTTDPGKVMRGDMAIIGCGSCHIGMVVSNDDAYHTIEGNTSPGSEGSQFNGGCVAERHRPHNQVIGWARVDFP
jgi:hypothetical protein